MPDSFTAGALVVAVLAVTVGAAAAGPIRAHRMAMVRRHARLRLHERRWMLGAIYDLRAHVDALSDAVCSPPPPASLPPVDLIADWLTDYPTGAEIVEGFEQLLLDHERERDHERDRSVPPPENDTN